jgi:hypothetical protein
MIMRLVAIALFELPQAVILPGPDVVRIGLQCPLVPDLRQLVVAELAIGVADQIGYVGAIVMSERLQLFDRRCIIVAMVDRGVGGAIAGEKFRIVDARALVALLVSLAGVGGGWRGVVAAKARAPWPMPPTMP